MLLSENNCQMCFSHHAVNCDFSLGLLKRVTLHFTEKKVWSFMYQTTHTYIIQDFISTKSPVKFSDTHYVHDSPQSTESEFHQSNYF